MVYFQNLIKFLYDCKAKKSIIIVLENTNIEQILKRLIHGQPKVTIIQIKHSVHFVNRNYIQL